MKTDKKIITDKNQAYEKSKVLLFSILILQQVLGALTFPIAKYGLGIIRVTAPCYSPLSLSGFSSGA
jgi:hypothetical protein